MSIAEALLAAIREAPEDDLPRLAYADWLEENGDPQRAEFIHVQIERANLPDGDERDAGLAGRERDLLRAGRGQWLRGLPEIGGIEWGEFSRGFVGSVRAESVDAFEKAEAAIRATIPLSGLCVNVKPHERKLARHSFAGLSELTLAGVLADDVFKSLFVRSPQLDNLRKLTLGDLPLTPLGAAALVASPHLTRLRELALWDGSPAVLRAVTDSPLLGRLVRLKLSGKWERPEVARTLASWRPGSLRRLTLSSCRLGTQSQPGTDSGAVLASAPLLAGLRVLEVIDGSIGPEGAAALAASDQLAGLAVLSLNDNPRLNDGGIQALAHKPRFRPHELRLGHVRMGPSGLSALLASPLMPTLRSLSLERNPLSDVGAARLAGCPAVAGLAHLDLSYTGLTDAAARKLARSPHLGGLRELRLESNACIGETARQELRERFGDALRI